MFKERKSHDITSNRPKVMLFGNGLTYSNETSWDNLILALSAEGKNAIKGIPYSLQATLCTDTDDSTRWKKYTKILGENYTYNDYPMLSKLLSLPFDAILTTNYTYEAENALIPGFSDMSKNRRDKFRYCTRKQRDTKSLLHTFYSFQRRDGNEQYVWHIHGEISRPTSVVLTLDEYERHLAEIIGRNKGIRDKYAKFETELDFGSWMDYLIMGDLYIVGLGFDFSEQDLWWLMNRRMREKGNTGKIVFFEPIKLKYNDIQPKKHDALRAAGAEIITFDVLIEENDRKETEKYQDFYEKVYSHLTQEFSEA